MYLKLKNGVVSKFPYSVGELRSDNPQVSFPETPPDALLADYGVVPYVGVPAPAITYKQNISEGTPVNTDGVWTQVWVVTDASAQEIAARTDAQWASVRSQRNGLLAESDWTQLPDAPVDRVPWATYRQALRDVTEQPDPFNIVWPTAPQ
jgi:hypothetical protein